MGDKKMNMMASSLQDKLESLPQSSSSHCLYKVPEHIRKVNRECYQPSIVSIGPIYYKKTSLQSSQELKLRHLDCFLELGYKRYSIHHYINIVQEWHDDARSYYEEKINLSREKFVEMMLIDAAFIIYYFMCHSNSGLSVPIDPMCKKIAWMVKVEQDLFLQDNQLPFFVLEKLYNIAFGKLYNITFKDLTCNFIGETYIPGREAARTIGRSKVRDAPYIMHLVDFLRICCLPPPRSNPNQNCKKKKSFWLCCLSNQCNLLQNRVLNNDDNKESSLCYFLRKYYSPKPNNQDVFDEESQFPKTNLKELKAAGVQFKAIDSENLLDIKYENGVLQIPTLTIQDTTEAILRNIIFFEQCQYFEDSYFIDYVFLLDALIDTPEDVKILVQQGIIKHWLGSEDEVATIVNRLTRYIMIYTPNFYYSGICRRLNAHASTRWNRWRAILKRDYFNHPWSSLSVGYLVILLVLTILQVYTGFKH